MPIIAMFVIPPPTEDEGCRLAKCDEHSPNAEENWLNRKLCRLRGVSATPTFSEITPGVWAVRTGSPSATAASGSAVLDAPTPPSWDRSLPPHTLPGLSLGGRLPPSWTKLVFFFLSISALASAGPTVYVEYSTYASGVVSFVSTYSFLMTQPAATGHPDDHPATPIGPWGVTLSSISLLFGLLFVALVGCWVRATRRAVLYILTLVTTVVLSTFASSSSGQTRQGLSLVTLFGDLSAVLWGFALHLHSSQGGGVSLPRVGEEEAGLVPTQLEPLQDGHFAV